MDVNFKISIKTIWLIFSLILIILFGASYLAYKEVIGVSDCGVIFATLLGPVFAVQVQSFKEAVRQKELDEDRKDKEIKDIRRFIFRQLMAYRANPIDNLFVQALNVVPVDFKGVSEVEVAYNDYIKHLGISRELDPSGWDEKCNDKRAFLLQVIASSLGHDFPIDEIKNNKYMAQGTFNRMTMQDEIVESVHKIVTNRAALNVLAFDGGNVTNPPHGRGNK
ncbi:DUF6680 family protein [Serratia sp. CY54717]|uniref:DUF6680 family protein n=1 Tax=Serratia sp. CY54717 TaxID=3383637 RepID=UPI003F9F32A5